MDNERGVQSWAFEADQDCHHCGGTHTGRSSFSKQNAITHASTKVHQCGLHRYQHGLKDVKPEGVLV